MGFYFLFSLLSGAMVYSLFDDNSNDNADNDASDEATGSVAETGAETEDSEDAVDPALLDTGASFTQTDDGIEIELGADETGELVAVYYSDVDYYSEPVTVASEVRYYLAPEGTDWSGASWETMFDLPGLEDSGLPYYEYMLDDFETQNGLELLGVVDLMDADIGRDETPFDFIGEVDANADIENFYLSAQGDANYLLTFLPEDYVVTRDGVARSDVGEDTTGTEEYDWIRAVADGVTIDGAGGDDDLETESANVTLLGGAGADDILAYGLDAQIDAGDGDDNVRAVSGTVVLGAGDDDATIYRGEAYGGTGNDIIYGYGSEATEFYNGDLSVVLPEGDPSDASKIYGEEGDDSLIVRGEGSEAYGGADNDFLSVSGGAVAFGEDGNDTMQMSAGGTADGGAGDDTFVVTEFLHRDSSSSSAIVVTGGAGADTFEATVRNAYNGEADFMRITDFDPTEDLLQVDSYGSGNTVSNIDIVEASDGSYSEVRVTFDDPSSGLDPGIAVIRLDGVTGMTADQVIVA